MKNYKERCDEIFKSNKFVLVVAVVALILKSPAKKY